MSIFNTFEEAKSVFDEKINSLVREKTCLDHQVYPIIDQCANDPVMKEFLVMNPTYVEWKRIVDEIKRVNIAYLKEKRDFGINVPQGDIDVEGARNKPIEEVISHYVPIKRGFCACPIHQEKTPSLKIYRDTNSWYCFGCHAGGDTIAFVMAVEQCDFVEAVKMIGEINV